MRPREGARDDVDDVRSFDDATQVVVGDVVTLYTEGWRIAVREHTTGAVYDALAQEMDLWDGDAARAFDAVADGLDALLATARQCFGELATAIAQSIGLPEWAKEMVGRVVASVTSGPFAAPLQAAAATLRVVGVALQFEIDELQRGEVLGDVTEPENTRELADQLMELLVSQEPAPSPSPAEHDSLDSPSSISPGLQGASPARPETDGVDHEPDRLPVARPEHRPHPDRRRGPRSSPLDLDGGGAIGPDYRRRGPGGAPPPVDRHRGAALAPPDVGGRGAALAPPDVGGGGAALPAPDDLGWGEEPALVLDEGEASPLDLDHDQEPPLDLDHDEAPPIDPVEDESPVVGLDDGIDF